MSNQNFQDLLKLTKELKEKAIQQHYTWCNLYRNDGKLKTECKPVLCDCLAKQHNQQVEKLYKRITQGLEGVEYLFQKLQETSTNHPRLLQEAIELAKERSKLSSCQKAKVACVIFSNEEILSVGFNVNRSYYFSCDSVACQVQGKNQSTNCGIIHAEIAALELLENHPHNGNQQYTYITHFPCTSCLYHLTKAGITTIFFTHSNYFEKDLRRMNPHITFTQC